MMYAVQRRTGCAIWTCASGCRAGAASLVVSKAQLILRSGKAMPTAQRGCSPLPRAGAS